MTGQKYDQWLATVDKTLGNLAGLNHADLEDIDWKALWAKGFAATHAARKVLLDVFGEL